MNGYEFLLNHRNNKDFGKLDNGRWVVVENDTIPPMSGVYRNPYQAYFGIPEPRGATIDFGVGDDSTGGDNTTDTPNPARQARSQTGVSKADPSKKVTKGNQQYFTRQEGQSLQQQINGMQQQVNGLQQQVNGLRQDVNGLRQDVDQLKTTVDQHTETLKQHGEKLDKIIKHLKIE